MGDRDSLVTTFHFGIQAIRFLKRNPYWKEDFGYNIGIVVRKARKQPLPEDVEGLEDWGRSGTGCFNPGISRIEEHFRSIFAKSKTT